MQQKKCEWEDEERRAEKMNNGVDCKDCDAEMGTSALQDVGS